MAQTQTPESIQTELARRHRAAVLVVAGLLVLTLALIGVAFVAEEALYRPGDLWLARALWIAIMVFGLGSFVLRRNRFNAVRLQDIAALRGISGLLATLQGTTVQVALIGGAIALMGFIVTMMTGNRYDMLRAGGVALIVLLYCYPQRSAWQRVVQSIEQAGNVEGPPPAKGMVA
ncbi:MAG TPA: hypothetical protein VF723_05510 [Pyrinomonadaceae bacterium]|jgi:hypothetical protein